MSVTEPSEASTVPVDALTIAAGEDVAAVAPAPARSQSELAHELDGLSLKQALIDFEVANARTRDLTQRLVALVAENRALEQELTDVREQFERERALWTQVRGSQAFRLASRIWNLRNALKG
jgi:DNA mismatch repair protein MutH